jgi:hypothetical protein
MFSPNFKQENYCLLWCEVLSFDRDVQYTFIFTYFTMLSIVQTTASNDRINERVMELCGLISGKIFALPRIAWQKPRKRQDIRSPCRDLNTEPPEHKAGLHHICPRTLTLTYFKRVGWTIGESGFEFQWGQEFSLLQVVQTGSGIHPTSYTMGTGGSFPGGKEAGASSWPLTSN